MLYVYCVEANANCCYWSWIWKFVFKVYIECNIAFIDEKMRFFWMHASNIIQHIPIAKWNLSLEEFICCSERKQMEMKTWQRKCMVYIWIVEWFCLCIEAIQIWCSWTVNEHQQNVRAMCAQ